MQPTNALQSALIETGLARPMTQTEQIWNVVKQDQPCNYRHIAKRTGLVESSVSSLLCQMEQRGMVYSRGAKGDGPNGSRKEYLTDMETYKLLPRPNQTAKFINDYLNGKDVTKQAKVTPATTTHPASPIDLDSLTIREAKALYQQLKELFT